MIQAVIFDLGRVLVDIHIRRLQRFFLTQTDVSDPRQALNHIMANPAMSQFNTGHIQPRPFYQRLCDSYGLSLSYDEFVFRWCDIFEPIREMEPIVMALGRSVRLGLLSNTDPLHWGHVVSNYPLMRCFARPTLSFEVGLMKPHPGIYAAAAKHVEAQPEECLFFDDLAENIAGAKAAGMSAICFEGPQQCRRELELLGLL